MGRAIPHFQGLTMIKVNKIKAGHYECPCILGSLVIEKSGSGNHAWCVIDDDKEHDAYIGSYRTLTLAKKAIATRVAQKLNKKHEKTSPEFGKIARPENVVIEEMKKERDQSQDTAPKCVICKLVEVEKANQHCDICVKPRIFGKLGHDISKTIKEAQQDKTQCTQCGKPFFVSDGPFGQQIAYCSIKCLKLCELEKMDKVQTKYDKTRHWRQDLEVITTQLQEIVASMEENNEGELATDLKYGFMKVSKVVGKLKEVEKVSKVERDKILQNLYGGKKI